MISLKPGVKIAGVKPELLTGLIVVASVLHEHGYGTVITAGTDGTHMENSLHYKGLAVDLRAKHIPTTEEQLEVLADCVKALGDDFDMILEEANTDNCHFHVEFQPKD